MFELKKLKNCRHQNTNAYNYVRDDGLIEDLIAQDDYQARLKIKDHLTGMRFCLDCGSTQRFRRYDPLAINGDKEPWLAPHIWRKS